ncbi:unnamed protein product [Kuraishia capsulata CBS 1993]|uniref:Trafficking protein particle complex subunit n=1 Tax=Kuraishia capsulata CBS 1993 TaxID=1382522 RepID=W6MNX3_9ASCO|nr:uncharacterized protein KUCA_T00003953001 [Kuraishia capsulata CBS 1993]CDK27973.1 unnamed protein product [Kuraishia capsulata CBS 1993]
MAIRFVSLITRDNRPLYVQPFSQYEGLSADQELGQKSEATAEDPEITTDRSTEGVPAETTGTTDTTKEQTISFIDEQNVNELLKYNFLSHMSLDIFESPFYERAPKGGNLLFIQDGIYVYGFETNTGLKIVLGTSEKEISEDALAEVFKDIHKAYLRLICNPFRSSKDIVSIENPTFDKRIKDIVTKWNGAAAETKTM